MSTSTTAASDALGARQSDSRVSPHIGDITSWRRDIHENPELEYDVQRTAEKVASLLRSFGADEVVEGIGRTGVVGVIKGQSTSSNLCIGLRADMDALPIIENTNLEYASKVRGKMHACGHDGHTAMLLGAAKVLCETRRFNGTAVVIFQPAEEQGAGGREMVNDGMMDKFDIQQVYGMHNMPNLALGKFGIRPGPMMAAADTIDVTLTGKGGHAAMPHLCVDTMLVAAKVISALQHIAARVTNPVDSVVVSITAVEGDNDSYNVIPNTVKLKGTVRTLNPAVQDEAESQVIKLITKTAEAYGASAEINYERNYPATINAVNETKFAAAVASQVVGADNVDDEYPPLLGAEDFSYMLIERPGAFIFIGNGPSAALHHPQYNFNDDAIAYGCSYWISIIETGMPAS